MKKRLAAALALALQFVAPDVHALNPGDIAFIGFNADGNDDLAFVTFVDIPAATEIHFSDNEWNGSLIGSGGAFNTGEGTYTWTASANVLAGSVVTINELGATTTSNLGTIVKVSGSLNLGASDEAVHAYQGTPTSPSVFLTAFGNDTPAAAGTSLAGTGLTEGVNAIFITGDADGLRYTGVRVGQASFAAYLPLIANTGANWETEATDGTLFLPFVTTAFTSAANSEVGIADVSVVEGDAGTVALEFTVSRTDPASGFSVDVALTGGTAIAGTDFVSPSPATLTFSPSGANSQTYSVTVTSDTELELDETVTVALSNVVNTTGTTTVATATATGTITNDDFLSVTYPPSNKVSFSKRGTISERSAGVPLAGAEIAAFDPGSDRAFLSSGSGIEVIDLSNPDSPVFVKNLDLTAAPFNLGSNNVSSVAVKNGVLAAAVIANPKDSDGFVVFINAATDAYLGVVDTGKVPDHVTFTPDGTKVLVANEGELTETMDVNSNPATDTIPGSVSIIDVSGGFASPPAVFADFLAFDAQAAALKAAGVRLFAGGLPSTDFEPEYFAISADSTKAMVTLQEANAVAVLDIATATFTSVVPLGEKDFSTLMADFSDRDGAGAAALLKPTTGNPVFGLYMPDQIASFEVNGQLYYVTANEGDDRDDFLPVEETIRVGDGSYDLDDTAFPNETTLKNNANLGRLTVSNSPGLRGDTDATPDGDIDRILAYGGRSFSILDSTGALVYDSGDMIEMIVASQFPGSFDDSRSDNKGPEPEGVTVMEVDGCILAFVGLERSNMVLVFDVTNPVAPSYVTALQNAGDVSPEGILTISATDSPSGRALVLVANEVSNSLTVYQINPQLIITEVQSNQVISGAGDYWELTNAGDVTVDLSGWSWDDSNPVAGTVAIPNGTMIGPGESVIFTAVAAGTFRTRWGLAPSVQVITGAGAPGLGGDDGVFLFDDAGVLITSFDYAAGNFTLVDGSPSLGGHAGPSAGGTLDAQAAVLDPFYGTANPRYTFADGTTLGTFESTASPDERGSPGSAFLEPQLLVTELNSSGSPADFWEVTNVGVAAVDLSGWSWDDDSDTAGTVVIPNGVSIAPGESIILTEADAIAFRTAWGLPGTVQVINGTGSFPGLGGGDRVTLFDADGMAVTSFNYGAGGFTKSDGSASAGGHAGLSAGGSNSAQSAILDPAFGTEMPRYTFADGTTLGTTNPTGAVTGSPGSTGLGAGPTFTLTVSVTPATFSESAANPAATGTVTRDGDTTAALTVTLSSSDETEAVVPATVEILAGQASAIFDVTAVDDSFPDGDTAVTITASAAGATPGVSNSITVQDDGDVLDTSFLLTEVLSQQDAAGVDDFWELTNISGVTKDISGYSWHDSGRSAATAATYKLPPGSSIAPGESVIFTKITPAAFRAWWGISNSVQVFQTAGAPGLGQDDGISFFDSGGNELFFFSYAAGGFTKADGNPSTGTHAGPSAGASTETQSAVWVPSSGTATPRYTFAAVGYEGAIASAASALDIASPGISVGLPTVSLGNAAINEGDSGTSILSLPVTRSDTATAFTVDYAVTGGTATSGTDFATLASGTLTFTNGGSASQTIDITVNGDTASEADETVIITLSNLVNTTGTTIISNAAGIGTIINDDVVPPAITTQPTGATIATGYTATLSLAATGTPAPTIQWYEGATGTTTTPVGTNSGTFTTPALNATTSYWARVTNVGGSVDSATAVVTVTPGVTGVDLSTYVRVARINLPEYRRTPLPPGTAAHNLLCDEASGVAYNWDTDTLFICGDGGRAITQVTKTGQLVDTMSLELNAGNPQGTEFYDPEGITYIGGGQFVFSEERERRLVKFTYVAGTTLTRAAAQTVDLGTFDDNTGTEGLSYDPQTSGFIVLKEKAPIGVFQTGIDFAAGTATNGSASTVNSTNLFDTTLLGMTDVADVFAFSNIPSMIGQPQAGNMLIIGQENARILNVDRSGNILSTLNISSDPGNPLSAADQQHEGITMDRAGIIYVVNENGGGSIEYPQLWVYAPSSLPNQAPTAITLNNEVNSLEENTSTASPIKVADIVVTDDGLGNNELSLSGPDAASFQLTGSSLFVKSGVVLDFETKTSYAVTINADDTTVGTTPDATYNFTLNITDQAVETPTPPALIVTEVAPWASSNGAVGGDWFEVTNVSASAVDITGWKVDDSSNAFATAIALNGITSIAPGESVIFIEGAASIVDTFKTVWFGASPPSGLQVGTYQGSGIGLSSGGDAVNLFTAGGTRHSGVSFGAADSASPFQTFDNTAAANDTAIAMLSEDGVNGAFVAATSAVEIGSPGYSAPGVLRVTEVAPWSSGNSPVAADWFEVTNVGARPVDITGWKVDDSSESPAAALPLTGITSIAPGESVIFIETATLSTKKAEFLANWFGASPPATLQVGAYSGGGIGLSTGGDAVNLYDTNNVRVANVSFGLAPSVAPFTTFDNAAGLDIAAITQFSAVGVNGAFIAANSSSEIGSPGSIQTAVVEDATVSIADVSVEEGNGASSLLTFTVTRSHNRGAFTVEYGTADSTATAPADYTAATGTLTFTADGDLSTTVSVTIIGDSIVEPDETFTVGLLNLVSTAGTAVLSDAVATGTIQNDDVYFPPTGALSVSNLGFMTMPFGAEIPAFDPASKRAFVSSNSGVQIVDLSDPAMPTLVSTIAPASLGVAAITSNDVSSVAVRKGYGANPAVVAAAIINSPKTQSGQVVFLNAATGALLGSVAVGAVPDNLTFTPDGSKVLVAIEGEMDGTAADPVEDTTQGGVAIIDVSGGFAAPTVTFANFAAYDSQVNALVTAGVRIFSKVVDVAGTPTRVYAAPSVDFEVEYVAVSPDGTKAMVTLQEANALAILDIATATFTSVVPLGEKDFSTLLADFSDRDGPGGTAAINLTTGNPVFGMYMPDAIASYQVGGQVYYVTANEGDDRNDFLTPDESTTVGNAGYDLDDATFPNEAALKDPAALGRLVTSNASGLRGDTDGDGDIDRILSYGARSFSIHDASGARVFDSADMIEKIVGTQFPANFFDSRSDNKGPEPEGVTVASLGGRTYAFVGLERSHMVLIFDVTNPAAVSYAGGAVRQGDLNPEGLVVVPAAESPTGRALLLVTSEDSNTLSVFELGQPAANFTLQLLHLSDGEAGLLASQTAPNLAALVDAFDDRYENTLIVSGGDNFIPSPFLNAGTDPLLNSVPWIGKTNFARPDIAIHNLLGVEASGIGNHEWDLGTNVFMDAIRPDGAWSGALFPHVSVNLDYSQDSAALARFTDVPLNGATTPVPAASSGASRLVPMAVVNKGGEKIGVLGVTTQILRAISSPSGTFAKGYPAGTTGADDMNLLASQLQPYVNELIAEGVNKIVLLSHLQQISNEQLLATKLTGVDIIVAAGSNTRLGDSDDVATAFPGHAANFANDYPLVLAGADGKPVLIVCTDNEYTYLGRLVVEFDGSGDLIVSNLAARIAENGAYAATTEQVAAAWGVSEADLEATAFAPGTKGARVRDVTEAVQTVIDAKDGTVYGYTAVYLEGERAFVRGQETNLGNITADANQQALRAIIGGTDPIVSLKNGGGIRAQIGAVSSLGGSAEKLPPPANPVVGKSEGGISQLDIENALRFNNRLMSFETTPAGLKAILEHGVASWPNQGRFPQIGGVAFAWDPTRASGNRVTSIALMNDDGSPGAAIYKEGPLSAAILRAAPPVIRMVTLNFLANDGDGYPMKANGTNFRYVLDDGSLGPVITDEGLNFTVSPQLPSNALGEQAAFATFLQTRHGSLATAFRQADTPASGDERVQIATFRSDTVPPMLTADTDGDGIADVLEDLIGLDSESGLRIGETLTMDLSPLAGTGSVLRLVGRLPAGLRFDPATGLITGQLLGLPGSYPVQIQELVNGRIVATQWLNFDIDAFPAGLLGGFEVLLEDTSETPRGIVRLSVTKAGAWSASLDFAGATRRRSRGTFTLVDGTQAGITAAFPATRGIPAMTVNLLLDATTPLVQGTYLSGVESGSGRGFRLVDRSSSVPLTQKLTMTLDAGVQDGVAYPAGIGWAKGSAGVTGTVSMSGSLGDAQSVRLGLKLSRTGQAVVWSQPYRNKTSYLGGIVPLAGLGQPLPFPQRQVEGLSWFKAADSRELSYEAGFAMPLEVTAASSRWDRPASATLLASALGLTDSTLAVEISGAGLSNATPVAPVLPTSFVMSSRYALTTVAPVAPAPVRWAGAVRSVDGGFSGLLTLPVGASNLAGRSAVSGVLLTDPAFGATVGGGLQKVPVSGKRAAFRTASVLLKQ